MTDVLPLSRDAIRVVIRHDVRRMFRLTALLEWFVWLLVMLLTLPLVIWMYVSSLFEPPSGEYVGSDRREPGSAPRDRPQESHRRVFHYRHRITVEVMGDGARVIARAEHTKDDGRAAEALVGAVLAAAREAGVFAEEQTVIGDWFRATHWNPSYPWGRQDLGPMDAVEARLKAAGFELERAQGEVSLRQRIPAPPFSVFLHGLGSAILLALALVALALLATPFALLAAAPILGLWFLVRPMHTTPLERPPSILQSMLRLGSVHRISFDGTHLRYRARRGLWWRRERFALSELVALEAAPSLSHGKRARWLPPRLRFVLTERTIWLDPELGEGAHDDVVDWLVHALAAPVETSVAATARPT